ncbi:MAG: hypothetical protein C0469_15390 [Cyanobacteria bacterium DS2.3.42]|nr:hypothetical protein [Cyanobacteria bacterium DS2.3.42]
MSFQTFENIPQSVPTEEIIAPTFDATESFAPQGLSNLQSREGQQIEGQASEQPAEVHYTVGASASFDEVIQSIYRDYQNGLFSSTLREYVPNYYMPTPTVEIPTEETVAAEEHLPELTLESASS